MRNFISLPIIKLSVKSCGIGSLIGLKCRGKNFRILSQYLSSTSMCRSPGSHYQQDSQPSNSRESPHLKLLYEGSLSKRILYLKSISIISSITLAASYASILNQNGLTKGLVGVGVLFIPFFVSPIVISWFFKRYITKLHYDPKSDTYTVHHYGLLMNMKSSTFKAKDVRPLGPTSILNTFVVSQGHTMFGQSKEKPFFLHDEALADSDSVELYKRMLGYDRISVNTISNSEINKYNGPGKPDEPRDGTT